MLTLTESLLVLSLVSNQSAYSLEILPITTPRIGCKEVNILVGQQLQTNNWTPTATSPSVPEILVLPVSAARLELEQVVLFDIPTVYALSHCNVIGCYLPVWLSATRPTNKVGNGFMSIHLSEYYL